ncbi:hypothetical protein NDU88_000705 [Pleurodeles waltl]|uniref:Uncharacterized protein n=1 Tax=Pleurodeles waltl TaxID=8319 RepID=A0AAV7R4Y4_PLEWA|nr:hypothetical protein NDU88_000705 [Pleurodeles waltl]
MTTSMGVAKVKSLGVLIDSHLTFKLRTGKRRGTVRFNIEGGRSPHKKKKQRTTTSPIQHPHVPLDSEAPKGPPLELLQSKTVFNVYRKAVHDTEGAELLEVLEMLHQLDKCRAAKAGRKRIGLVTKFLAMDCSQSVWSMNPVPKTVIKRLRTEVNNGKISDECLEAIGGFLLSLLEESFGRFWKDMAEGLIACGVQTSQVGAGGWVRLEPLLHTMASKLILRRLKKRKAKMVHQIRAQPTPEDATLLSRSLQLAAEGWPTIEMLHFLKYLQTYGPMEDLPLLENHLRFCLEVQKYRNAHHDVPDKALLKKKSWILRDCFLASQVEPSLQVRLELWASQKREERLLLGLRCLCVSRALGDPLVSEWMCGGGGHGTPKLAVVRLHHNERGWASVNTLDAWCGIM